MFPQWSCLSCENINQLMELSVDQVQLQFAERLDLKNNETCVKEASLLDYFVGGFWWAKEMSFTCQQISFIMALLQLLLDNIRDKRMTFADNFKEFTRMLLAVGKSSTSPNVNPLFDMDQLKSITDFLSSRLYEFLFTHPRDELLLGMERSIEIVNSSDFIAPLEDGIPTDDLRRTPPSPAVPSDQDFDEHPEKSEEESAECEQEESLETTKSFTVEDVREVLGEVTREMLGKLQEDFTEKLRIQEKTYTTRLESLKRVTSKK
ncbi:hypothetical protein Baya_0543 [Bagarius yarrelli]|uniref:Ciliary-associated calcium-binding coiled-coil protein 1 n=1 Tax=Bagarius yarrelli TaxID=175774 RepID=A0A556TII9_BAGYA|nr:hypothetical protein Baya_0543 [Bagarius yarrelli]